MKKDLLHKLHLVCVKTLVPGVIIHVLASTICLGIEIKAKTVLVWWKPNPTGEHRPADRTVCNEMLQPKVTAPSCLMLCSHSKTAATKHCPCFRLG